MNGLFEIGSAPINWGIEGVVDGNPDPGEVLDAVTNDGYAGCELGAHGYFGLTADDILGHFAQRRLAVVASWAGVDLARPLAPDTAEELRLIASFLEAGGSRVLLISDKMTEERIGVAARVDRFPESWWTDDEWSQVPRTLGQILDLAGEFGLQVAVHPHVGTHLETGPEIRRLLDLTEGTPIRLCLDTGHIQIGGSDPIALLRRDGSRLAHVHAKDVDAALLEEVRAGRQDYFQAIGNGLYCDLGAGIVDWPGLRAGLDACAFSGWVVVEQDQLLKPGSRQPYESNTKNRHFLRSLLNA